MINNKPLDNGNVNCIKEEVSVIIRLAIIRYDEIFQFYSTEPVVISIKKDSKSETIVFHQILRVRKWKRNVAYSYQIFSRGRVWEENNNVDLIVRKVEWNVERDTQLVKKANGNRDVLDKWPGLDIQNIYLDHNSAEEIMNEIADLDHLIENGIVLTNVSEPSWDYKDLELLRRYDWGQIHSTWSPSKENRMIEDKLECIRAVLDNVIDSPHDNIEQMTLCYSDLPETYKNLRYGN